MSYIPRPLETSAVELDDSLLELTETLAKNVHDVWAGQRLQGGWRYGPQRDDTRKLHPCLVPYEDLPHGERELDRAAAMETVKAICALGWRLLPPESDA